MSKTCAQLCAAMGGMIIGNAEESIEGLAYRSDKVEPGYAFFCIVGLKTDGHSFAQDAINRGAKVLVVERKVYLADATDVTEIIVKDSRKALAQAAAAFYDHPSKDMALVGITGTNGKTTTTYLVNHIVNTIGKRCGVIGTVGVTIGNVHEKSEHTTPESSDLQALLARMRDAQCDVVAMEELQLANRNLPEEMTASVSALYLDRFSELNHLCDIYYDHSGSSRQKNLVFDKLNETIDAIKSDHKRLKELEVAVNRYRDNVMEQLREVPRLTERDLRIALYTFAGFSNRAISIFLDSDPVSISRYRYNLKQKIKNSGAEHSEQLLNALSDK